MPLAAACSRLGPLRVAAAKFAGRGAAGCDSLGPPDLLSSRWGKSREE